jgi:predicted transcriptional regulator
MKISKIIEVLEADLLTKPEGMEQEIFYACGSDLMSDVMAYVKESNILLFTGLVNPQVIRTAEMMDIKAVVFVRGKVPGENIIKLADQMNIVVLTTKLPMFTACGRLYGEGINGRCGHDG